MPVLHRLPSSLTLAQAVGLAKQQGFSPTDNLRSLTLLLAAALAGSVAFARLQRHASWPWTQSRLPWIGAAAGFAASVDGGSLLAVFLTSVAGLGVGALIAGDQITKPCARDLALQAAHAMIAWTLLAPVCSNWLGSPSALALILLALSILVGSFSAARTDSGQTSLGGALLVAPLALLESRSRWLSITAVLPFLAAMLTRRSRHATA
jgi:hypothetical protein